LLYLMIIFILPEEFRIWLSFVIPLVWIPITAIRFHHQITQLLDLEDSRSRLKNGTEIFWRDILSQKTTFEKNGPYKEIVQRARNELKRIVFLFVLFLIALFLL